MMGKRLTGSRRLALASVAVSALVVLAALLWWDARHRGEADPEAVEGRTVLASDLLEAQPEVATLGLPSIYDDYRVEVAPLDPLSRTPEEAGELGGIWLQGRVSGPGGAIDAAQVFVHLVPPDLDPGGRLVRRARSRSAPWVSGQTGPSGEYALELALRAETYAIEVAVWAEGHLPGARGPIAIGRSSPVVVDFVLEPGESISGWVVEADGSAAVGAPVFATRDRGFDYADLMLSTRDLLRQRWRMTGADPEFLENVALTDGDGHFQVFGLLPGEYSLVSGDPARIWASTKVVAGESSVVLRAEPSRLVRMCVLDGVDSEPIERFQVTLHVPLQRAGRELVQQTVRVGQGVRGQLELGWIEDRDLRIAGEVRWSVSANGYRSAHGALASVLHPVETVEVQLIPEDMVELRLRASLRSGAPVSGELHVDYAEPGGGRRGRAIARASSDALHVCEIPSGRWFLQVTRATDVNPFGAWRGEFIEEVKPHSSPVHLDVVLADTASIEIELGDSAPGELRWTLLLKGDAHRGQYSFTGTRGELTGLRPGTWSLVIDAGPLGWWEREVSVAVGERVELRLPD